MNDIERAKYFCKLAHGNQMRKYTGEMYYTHPFAVATIVETSGADIDTIVAAYLHDTIEDTVATYAMIKDTFNKNVANLVLEVSDVSRESDGNREKRKGLDKEHLAKASNNGKTIKLADLIHNSDSIIVHDKNFAKAYMKEKKELLKVLEGGNSFLYFRATAMVYNYFKENK